MGFGYDFTNGNCKVLYTVEDGEKIDMGMLRRIQEAGESFFLLPVELQKKAGSNVLCYDISNVTNLLAWKDEASSVQANVMDRRLEEAVRDLELNMISREDLVMDPRFIYVDDRDGEIRILALPVTAAAGGFDDEDDDLTVGRPVDDWEASEGTFEDDRWTAAAESEPVLDEWDKPDTSGGAWNVPGGFEMAGGFSDAPKKDSAVSSAPDGWEAAEEPAHEETGGWDKEDDWGADADDGWKAAEMTEREEKAPAERPEEEPVSLEMPDFSERQPLEEPAFQETQEEAAEPFFTEAPEEPVRQEAYREPEAPVRQEAYREPEAPVQQETYREPEAPVRQETYKEPEAQEQPSADESAYAWNRNAGALNGYSSYHRSALDGWETPRRTVLDGNRGSVFGGERSTRLDRRDEDFGRGGYDDDDERTVMLGTDDDEATVMLGAGYGRSIAKLVRQRTGEVFRLEKSENKIGKRERSVDICIRSNPALSREHCAIRLLSGVYYLEDLNSSNGTYLNGEMIAPGKMVRLSNGCKIRMADEEFVFQES